MLSMVEYVHRRIMDYKDIHTAIDFTMGRGSDTAFLMHHAQEVYSFDIQPTAIDITREKIGETKHVHLILDSHENFDRYVTSFDVGVFNLGYLPQGDKKITTTTSTSLEAIKKAVKLMNKALFVVCYIGHEEGEKEACVIEDYASHLDHLAYNVSVYKMLNKGKAPYVIEIQKRQQPLSL